MTIEGHCTDITGDLGIEFLKTRPEDKPLFLILHQKAPHRAKTRLLALLRRLGYNYDGKTHWTEAHKRYLRHLTLPDAAHNRVLEDNLTTVDFHVDRIARLEEAMLQLLEDWQRKPLVEALMAFLGLVPTENTSGNKQSRGGISKSGNPHALWILIEQATHYRVPPKVSAQLSARQEGVAPWIKNLSWATQTRLSHRFSNLRKRQVHHNKIKVSVARELCGFIWELSTKIEAKQGTTTQN